MEKKQQPPKNKCSWSNCCVPNQKKPKQDNGVYEKEIVDKENQENLMEKKNDEDPPYNEELPRELTEGTCITIKGYIKSNCHRFAVNLLCGKDPNSDIALHVNPRISQRYVVRNNRTRGVWGKEETTSLTKFTIQRNQNFTMDIVCTSREFLIAYDKNHLCGYVYRVPLDKIKALRVEGPINVLGIEYRTVSKYPEGIEVVTIPIGERGAEPIKIQTEKWVVPITGRLPQGFQQGWQLEICGRVKILPNAFYINLQNGEQFWPHPNVYLHLNSRFNVGYGKHILVRNAWMDGEWGPEERTSGFHFSPGSVFSVAIEKGDDEFSVWIDGQLVGEFQFRGKVEDLNTVYIQGDVVIDEIFMNKKTDKKYMKIVENVVPNTL